MRFPAKVAIAGVAMAAAIGFGAQDAHASEGDLEWRWRRLGAIDYAALGVVSSVALAEQLAPSAGPVRWRVGWAVDREVQRVVALGGVEERRFAARLSDVFMASLVLWSVSDAAVATWAHEAPDVGLQLASIAALSHSFNLAATGLVKRASGRDRPIQTQCDADPRYDPSCDERRPPRSFLSGHTSTAFTGAALICQHHQRFALYGPGWDPLSCMAATTAAAMVGWQRVLADKHYLTDVVAGAGLGIVSGAVLPELLVYAWDASPAAATSLRWLPAVSVTPDGTTLRWAQRW
ncbi:MAG: phosphatase PAP2 family protein [Myxococcota bacterium]